ncbi:hypothetical protein BR93DRAFT_583242 [Coniochaeta sp. PMI_546]|nr:hypothetical protein BR93DRAFT_583242 [Coniochaeta sp. PMI_546]
MFSSGPVSCARFGNMLSHLSLTKRLGLWGKHLNRTCVTSVVASPSPSLLLPCPLWRAKFVSRRILQHDKDGGDHQNSQLSPRFIEFEYRYFVKTQARLPSPVPQWSARYNVQVCVHLYCTYILDDRRRYSSYLGSRQDTHTQDTLKLSIDLRQ